MRPLFHAKADRFRRKSDELEKVGEQKLAAMKARSQEDTTCSARPSRTCS